MVLLLGLIHAGKQSGYVMVQNIIQKLIIKPQVAESQSLKKILNLKGLQIMSVVQDLLCPLCVLITLMAGNRFFLRVLLSVIANK